MIKGSASHTEKTLNNLAPASQKYMGVRIFYKKSSPVRERLCPAGSCVPAGGEHPVQGGPEAAVLRWKQLQAGQVGRSRDLSASLGRKDQSSVSALKKLQGPRPAAPPPKDDPLQPLDL